MLRCTMSYSYISKLPVIDIDAAFDKYLREVSNIPSLSQEDEFLLAKSYLENHDLKAAQKLVTSHLKLVVKIAMQYKNYGFTIAELISEGNLGLMQAVKKYNPYLGYRLSTYAMWWINSFIKEYVLKSWSLVRIGTNIAQKKLFFNLRKIKNKLTKAYSRDINEDDYQEIADKLGVNAKEVGEMDQILSGHDFSLNFVTSNQDAEEQQELMDFISDDKSSQEEIISNNQLLDNRRKILADAMQILDEREAKILAERKLRPVATTLDKLSIEYKISKERVRQIENKAFLKIQSYVLDNIGNDGQIGALNNI